MEEKKDEKDFKELKEELSELFEARKFLKIKEIITSMNEVDTAELLESIDEEMAGHDLQAHSEGAGGRGFCLYGARPSGEHHHDDNGFGAS